MTEYLSNFKYSSSKNGKTNKYNFRDRVFHQMINSVENITSDKLPVFYEKSHHGFGSDYSADTTKYESVAAALEEVIPRWKICS